MKIAFEKKYHEIENTHFWFKARRDYILQLLKNHSKKLSILDIGCSSGILLTELINKGFDVNELYGIDISSKAVQNCKENGIQNSFEMDAQNIDLKKRFDIIIASDCLEHLENDTEALKNWYELLKPDGILYVFVPAFMALWSEHDAVNLHYRRYTKKGLKYKLYKCGFEICKSSYWNFFLFLPIIAFRAISKLIQTKKLNPTGDLNGVPLFNNFLFQIIHIENKLLKLINFPFGVSVYCIAKRPSLSKVEIKDLHFNE